MIQLNHILNNKNDLRDHTYKQTCHSYVRVQTKTQFIANVLKELNIMQKKNFQRYSKKGKRLPAIFRMIRSPGGSDVCLETVDILHTSHPEKREVETALGR